MNRQIRDEKSPNMRIYLAQMCEKFTETFKKMKELRHIRSNLETENNQIRTILAEESKKLESTLTKLKEDLTKIQEKRDELMKKSADFQKQLLALSLERTQKQYKLQEILDEAEFLKKESSGEGIEARRNLERSIIDLTGKLDELKDATESSKRKEIAVKAQLEELNKTKEKKEEDLMEVESVYKDVERNSLEKVVQDHEVVSNYRRNLKENRETFEIIERKEKDLEILSQELESKLERLKTIIANNKSLKAKMSNNEENTYIYQQLSNENQTLRDELTDLKAKISELQPKNNNKNYYSSHRDEKNQSIQKNLKLLDMNLQMERNGELREKMQKMQKELEEKENEFDEIKRENMVLKEKKADFNKEYQGDEEKKKKLVEYYDKLSEGLDSVREKLQGLI